MKFEIRIWHSYDTDQTHIIIFDRTDRENRVINLYTGVIKVLSEYEKIPDEFILKIPNIMAAQFFQAFAEALDQQGIKTENDFKIQGLLEATKYHLEDMRKLVFKKGG